MINKPFNTVRFESFVTEYHKKLITGNFKADLENYLCKELLPQVTIPFNLTKGSLKPSYNEERFCGENSAVKNLFSFEFRFSDNNQVEEIKVELKYLPQKRNFVVRYKKPLYLWTIPRQQSQRTNAKQIEDICNSILGNEIETANCPVCEKPVRICNSPSLFDVSCSNLCFTYDFHRNAETGAFEHGHFFMKEPDNKQNPSNSSD